MNRTLATLAGSALALGAIGLTATEAPAQVSDGPGNTTVTPHDPKPPNYPNYDPRYEVLPVQATTLMPHDPKPPNYPNYDPRYEVLPVQATTVMPHDPKPPNYPNYDPRYEVSPVQAPTVSSASDDNGAEVLQAGASALGGAAIAFGAMWLYRRRQTLAA